MKDFTKDSFLGGGIKIWQPKKGYRAGIDPILLAASVNVSEGQKVKKGAIIGFVGNTGRSQAPHLHYEVWKDKKTVNPINYYLGNLSPEEFDDLIKLANQENQSLD